MIKACVGNLGWGCAPNTDSLDEAWRDPRFPLFHLTGVRRHRVPLPPTLFPTRRSPRASLLPLLQNQDVISSLTANPKPPWLGRSRPTRQACPPRVRTQLNLTKLKKIKKKNREKREERGCPGDSKSWMQNNCWQINQDTTPVVLSQSIDAWGPSQTVLFFELPKHPISRL